MNIEEIKSAVDLLKKANCQQFVSLPELARETKKTRLQLMEFLEENENLFHLSQRWQPKEKVVTRNMFGTKFKDKIQVRGRNLGICIDKVFLSPKENWRTDEWLALVKIEKAKYIHITEWDNYGYIQGYYIQLDKEGHEFRYHLWRNTPEKLEEIKKLNVLETRSYGIGGFGDYSSHNITTAISPQGLEILKQNGWEFNELKPLS